MPLHAYAAPFAQVGRYEPRVGVARGFVAVLPLRQWRFSTVLDCTPTELHNYLPAQLHG